jgi:phenylpropionate dioxygenase-like ring-hydroxylating dioxygenase large terminal subunit
MISTANGPHTDFDLRRVGTHPDHWYPLAWSDEIKPGKALACRFAGDPVVLFRGKSGQLFALEDRCAHRQVPLSLGVVEGESLKCGYHGWKYDCAGACIDVPYLGRERLPNGVRGYPVREVDGLAFIFPGRPALAESRVPTALGAAGDPRYKTRRLNREIACHYTFLHENLFDMNHQFLHRSLMGSIKAKCLDRRQGEDWCEVDYTFTRTAGRASLGESAILNVVRKPADAANADLMTIRTGYPHQSLRVWVNGGEPVLDVWLGYTPLDTDQRRTRTFGYLSVKKPPIPGLIHLAWPFVRWFTEAIFAQDKDIMEQEQKAHDAQGGDWNNEVFRPILDLRAVLGRCGVPMEQAREPLAAVVPRQTA